MAEKRKYTIPEKSNIPFEVPDMYFQKSFEEIIARKESLARLPYETPALYFEELTPQIESRILPKEQPFAVPQDYFQDLSRIILERKNENKTSTSLAPWYWGIGAAATLILMVTLFITDQKTDDLQAVTFPSSKELIAAIDKSDIHTYLENNAGANDEVILEVAEQKNVKLPEFGDQKISKKEKEEWKQELELEDLDDLDLEM